MAAREPSLPPGEFPVIPRIPKYKGPERRKKKRRRPRPLRVLFSLMIIAIVGYGAAVLWLMQEESSLVLEAGRTLGSARPPFPYEQIDVPRTDANRQFAWMMPRAGAAGGPWTLFLHGNASTIASNVNISHYAALHAAGLNVLAPEFRGFGGLGGSPTEATLGADARAAYDYLRAVRHVDPSTIVIYGWSLGSAVAVDLATMVDPGAVILEAAPASQAGLSERRYPFFPIRLLTRSPFDSIGKIDRVHAPILVLHSPDDVVIPIAEGRRLFEAARSDKSFVEVRGGHVSASEIDAERFARTIAAFLSQHGVLTPPRPAIRP
jgi:hypothetical protein